MNHFQFRLLNFQFFINLISFAIRLNFVEQHTYFSLNIIYMMFHVFIYLCIFNSYLLHLLVFSLFFILLTNVMICKYNTYFKSFNLYKELTQPFLQCLISFTDACFNCAMLCSEMFAYRIQYHYELFGRWSERTKINIQLPEI